MGGTSRLWKSLAQGALMATDLKRTSGARRSAALELVPAASRSASAPAPGEPVHRGPRANPARVRSAVSSSQASMCTLRAAGVAVVDLNELPDLAL